MRLLRIFIPILVLSFCTLSAAPAVTDVTLYKDNTGGTVTPAYNKLTGGDPMTLYFKVVTAPSTLSTLKRITVTIWNTNVASLNDVDSENHATYNYYFDTLDWSLLFGSTGWDLNKTFSTRVSNNSTDQVTNFRLVFTPGSSATSSTLPVWCINIKVTNNLAEATNIMTYYSLSQSGSSTSDQTGGGTLFVAPNPVNIGTGHKARFFYSKNWGEACSVDLQIYTIYGELVKNVVMGKAYLADQTLDLEWDGNNGADRQVASGIYTAIMTVTYSSSYKERLVSNFAVYK